MAASKISPSAAAKAPPPGRTAAQVVSDYGRSVDSPQIKVTHVAAAWQGLWLVLQGLVWLVAGRSYQLEILTPGEALEDAQILWPLVERHPVLARILSWIGAPIALVRRVAAKIKRKDKAVPDASAPRA